MRQRQRIGMVRVAAGALAASLVFLFGCHLGKKVTPPAPPPVPPPSGWRIIGLRNNSRSLVESFAPEAHDDQTKPRMMVQIDRNPKYSTKPEDLTEQFIRLVNLYCKKNETSYITRENDNIVFERKYTDCHKGPHQVLLARVIKRNSDVAFVGYLALTEDIPQAKKDEMLKYMTTVRLEAPPPPPPEANPPQ
jgi:hypothetical protein